MPSKAQQCAGRPPVPSTGASSFVVVAAWILFAIAQALSNNPAAGHT
jgi:hypothetical protein